MTDLKAAYGEETSWRTSSCVPCPPHSPTIDALCPQVAMHLGCPCSTCLGLFDRKLANNLEILILSQFRPHLFCL